jgi:GNAT superfamily N-acetyltransferase
VAELSLREARLTDAAPIAELSGILGYPLDATAARERLERLTGRSETTVFVATLPEAGVVGWLHVAVVDTLESGRRCEIAGLVVHPDHRRHGAGRRLVARAERWAAARGFDSMAVRSNVVRAESHPFYERLGYTRAKTQHAYRKELSAGA